MAKQLASFETVNANEFNAKMREVGKSMKDMTVANKKIAIQTFAWVQRNFKSEGGQVGGWKPLAQSTINRRRKGKGAGGAKILQDSGDLRNQWKLTWTRFRMAMQSQVFYSNIHDQQKEYQRGGGGSSKGKIPQRRILPNQQEAGVYIQKIYEMEFESKLDKASKQLAKVKGVRKI